ncbi:MAG TPA: hypothetical protein VML95_00300 [Longimicrobiales bacterium]|nr:hypothetical protein [Longimicrobiales bacterium]
MCKNSRGGTSVRSFALATLLLSGMMVGCESDDGMGPLDDFDEEATAADVDAVLNAVDDDITVTLLLAGEGLATAAGATAAMPAVASLRPGSGGIASFGDLGAAKVELAAARLLPALYTSASPAAEPIFPSNLLGKTFVWGGSGYVVDDTITGAPIDGVRFVVYAISPITRQPVEPLVEVGYLDLTDESSPASSRLGLLLIDTTGETEVARVDYFIDVSFIVTETAAAATLFASGFVSDGMETLNFVLDQTLEFEESGTGSFTVDYDFIVASSGVSLAFDATTSFDAETEETSGLVATMTLSGGGDVVALSVTESATGTLDGEITFNGVVAILVSGPAVAPAFTRPDGGELTAAEVQALVAIVDAVTEVLLFAEKLFAPISGVIAA